MMRSITPVVPHLRPSASRQDDRIGRLNSILLWTTGASIAVRPSAPAQTGYPRTRADVPPGNGFAMNASWCDAQTAAHDRLVDAPRGTHSTSVPRGTAVQVGHPFPGERPGKPGIHSGRRRRAWRARPSAVIGSRVSAGGGRARRPSSRLPRLRRHDRPHRRRWRSTAPSPRPARSAEPPRRSGPPRSRP